MRAPDWWESARFLANFHAFSFFWLDGFASPSASHARRGIAKIG